MSTTNTDAVSIIVTLLGCGLAIYGIVSEPLVVDSTRPTQTGEAGKVRAEVPAYARLWDDPFAVYPDTDELESPAPALLATDKTLFSIVPTKTQSYEDDKENRIRIRYAIERALFYEAIRRTKGNLDQDRWVLLGPSDSDSFAYFNRRSQENSRSDDVAKSNFIQVSNPGEFLDKLWGDTVSGFSL